LDDGDDDDDDDDEDDGCLMCKHDLDDSTTETR
jgi:hypothetical protein